MHASRKGRKDRRQHRQQEIRHVKIILGDVNNNNAQKVCAERTLHGL